MADCYGWPRECDHFDDLDCFMAEQGIDPTDLPTSMEPPWRIRLSYWLRPYDSHLDRRRWRWTRSGCSQSRDWWARNGHLFSLPTPADGGEPDA